MDNAPVSIPLTPEDAASLRSVIRARVDAARAAELAALRAKLAVGEAIDAEMRLMHALGDRYAFDAELTYQLDSQGVLRLMEPAK